MFKIRLIFVWGLFITAILLYVAIMMVMVEKNGDVPDYIAIFISFLDGAMLHAVWTRYKERVKQHKLKRPPGIPMPG